MRRFSEKLRRGMSAGPVLLRTRFCQSCIIQSHVYGYYNLFNRSTRRRSRTKCLHGDLVGLTAIDLCETIASGNACLTRLLFELNDTNDRSSVQDGTFNPTQLWWLQRQRDGFYRYWSAAVLQSDGRCDVLDVVREYAVRRDGASTLSEDYLGRIRHASVARWFVEHFGARSLPNQLVLTALRTNRLGLFYFLRKTQGQVTNPLLVNASTQDATQRTIYSLITKCTSLTVKLYGNALLSHAAKSNDVELIEQVLADWGSDCSTAAVQKATDAL